MGYDNTWTMRDPYALYDARIKRLFGSGIIISERERKNNLQIFEVLRTITAAIL